MLNSNYKYDTIQVNVYTGTAVGVNKIQQGFIDLSLCPILIATNLYNIRP